MPDSSQADDFRLPAEPPQPERAAEEPPRNPVLRILRLWFLLRDPVTPRAYAVSGFALMLSKYVVEAFAFRELTGRWLTPLEFVNPLLTQRQDLLRAAPPGVGDWLGIGLVLWSLPFLWISVAMSIRRTADAGHSPWAGLLVLVPILNMGVMLLYCVVPSAPVQTWRAKLDRREYDESISQIGSAVAGIAVAAAISGLMLWLSVYTLDTYGASLFFATPLVAGAAAAFFFNRSGPQSYGNTLAVSLLAIGIPGAALLLFALEGAICLIMAVPIVVPIGLVGGVIGKVIADATTTPSSHIPPMLLVLPILAGVESATTPTPEHLVTSSVEIDAPPEVVWRNVVDFPPIDARAAWYFRAGIACPMEATIEGNGVGAVRRCVFTTGEFVEPITAWEEPRRLAFDVREQPHPMNELNPFGSPHPPHLDGALQSTRGEFRLTPLPGGRTRLEGRTWYRLEMAPRGYWKIWTDAIIHRIHLRVLDHIRRESLTTVKFQHRDASDRLESFAGSVAGGERRAESFCPCCQPETKLFLSESSPIRDNVRNSNSYPRLRT